MQRGLSQADRRGKRKTRKVSGSLIESSSSGERTPTISPGVNKEDMKIVQAFAGLVLGPDAGNNFMSLGIRGLPEALPLM